MTERTFKIQRDPYEENIRLYKKTTITLQSGLTVLVGCNGSGKTTLLKTLKYQLKKENIPVLSYDNLHDGGQNSISEAFYYGDSAFGAEAFCSSEGEIIILNMCKTARIMGDFIRSNGEDNGSRVDKMAKAFAKAKGEKLKEYKNESNEIWILLDAIDSGLSVDNIVDLKEYIFKTVLEYNCGHDIYIVVSANEYEMCAGEKCFDVQCGKYVNIKSYEDYKQVILKSRKFKDKLYEVKKK